MGSSYQYMNAFLGFTSDKSLFSGSLTHFQYHLLQSLLGPPSWDQLLLPKELVFGLHFKHVPCLTWIFNMITCTYWLSVFLPYHTICCLFPASVTCVSCLYKLVQCSQTCPSTASFPSQGSWIFLLHFALQLIPSLCLSTQLRRAADRVIFLKGKSEDFTTLLKTCQWFS